MVNGGVKLWKTSVLFEVGETVEYAIVVEIEVEVWM